MALQGSSAVSYRKPIPQSSQLDPSVKASYRRSFLLPSRPDPQPSHTTERSLLTPPSTPPLESKVSPQLASSLDSLQSDAQSSRHSLLTTQAAKGSRVVLYIFRVPDTSDLCLSPVKPLRAIVTELDIQHALYYVRVVPEQTAVLLRGGEAVARIAGKAADMLAAEYRPFERAQHDDLAFRCTFKEDMKGSIIWQTPWNGYCVFRSEKAKDIIHCEHYGSDAVHHSSSAAISTLKFNLPGLTTLKRKRNSLIAHRKSLSVESSAGAALNGIHLSWKPVSVQQASRTYEAPKGPRPFPERREFIDDSSREYHAGPPLPPRPCVSYNSLHQSSTGSLRGGDFAAVQTAASSSIDDCDDAYDKDNRVHDIKVERRPPALPPRHKTMGNDWQTPKDLAENANSSMSVTQTDKLGGGFLGNSAKLAKLEISGAGQQMLDMAVAANLYIFFKAYRLPDD